MVGSRGMQWLDHGAWLGQARLGTFGARLRHKTEILGAWLGQGWGMFEARGMVEARGTIGAHFSTMCVE